MDEFSGVTWTEYQQSIEAARVYLAGSVAGRKALASEAGAEPAQNPRPNGKAPAVIGAPTLFDTQSEETP